MIKLSDLILEATNEKPAFEEFAEKRFKGAKKIADNAKEIQAYKKEINTILQSGDLLCSSMYKKGINPDVTDLKIKVDSKNYKVNWEVKIEPSKNGKAYTGFMTYGSAGNSADSRAKGQEESTKKRVGGENYELVLDFKNPTGIYIRQLFYKYTLPNKFPNH